MSSNEQIEHLTNDLEKVIRRYRSEYNLSYASVVGVIEILKLAIVQEAFDDEESE